MAARKKSLQPVAITPSAAPLPNVIELSKRSLSLLGKNWKQFAGIGLWYAAVAAFFGAVAISGYNVAAVRDQLGGKLLGSIGAYASLIGSGGGVTDQAGSVYSSVLFVVFSLAVIWALRNVHENSKIRIRDAYYKGMYPLIPFVLVLLVALLACIPAILASGIYQYVMSSGIKAGVELAVWTVVLLIGILLSMYLLVAPILALYIVSLPNMAPIAALKSARLLALSRRWLFVRKMLFLPIVLLLSVGIIVVPFILLAPAAAQWILAVVGVIVITFAHGYLYELYRSSME